MDNSSEDDGLLNRELFSIPNGSKYLLIDKKRHTYVDILLAFSPKQHQRVSKIL
jgi:hypothetical protein